MDDRNIKSYWNQFFNSFISLFESLKKKQARKPINFGLFSRRWLAEKLLKLLGVKWWKKQIKKRKILIKKCVWRVENFAVGRSKMMSKTPKKDTLVGEGVEFLRGGEGSWLRPWFFHWKWDKSMFEEPFSVLISPESSQSQKVDWCAQLIKLSSANEIVKFFYNTLISNQGLAMITAQLSTLPDSQIKWKPQL